MKGDLSMFFGGAEGFRKVWQAGRIQILTDSLTFGMSWRPAMTKKPGSFTSKTVATISM